ncbi:MAG: PQQ-binding-like beta-propeller repeat protein [Planctomycetaceae bacterium]
MKCCHRLRPLASFTSTVAACIGFFLSGAVHATDWPTFRGDNSRSGATTENFPGASFAWRISPPAPPRRAWSEAEGRTIEGHVIQDRVRYDDAFQPVVAGRRVFFGSSSDHQVRCLDLETGRILWRFFTGGPVRLAPTVFEERVYFGSDDGYAYCLDVERGNVVWQKQAGPHSEWFIGRGEMISRWPIRTGILVDAGIAYFGAGIFPHEDVYLHALDARTGRRIWNRDDISESDAGRDDLSPQGYLLASEDHLFIPSGRSMPATFEKSTGTLLHKKTYSWRSSAGGVVGGTRALLADGQLYSGGAHHLLAIEQKTGNIGYGWFDGHDMVVAGSHAYVATGTFIAKIDREKYAINSRQRRTLENDIYSASRSLRSAKTESAKKTLRDRIDTAQKSLEDIRHIGIVWQTESANDAAMLISGDRLLVGGEGQVTGYDLQTGQELLKLKVNGLARGLVVANGRFLVSTTTGEISCFQPGPQQDVPPTESAEYPNPYPDDAVTALCRKAAAEIIRTSAAGRGFALVVGSEDGRLAYALAQQTDLKIYGIEPDREKVSQSREMLARAGLYGSRVTIHHADLNEIPYSNFFANLIVSDSYLRTGTLPGNAERILRHLKPLGGVALLGTEIPPTSGRAATAATAWLNTGGFVEPPAAELSGNLASLTRGALPGAADWSHQYGNAANTAIINDTRVKGDLGVLWFGDPGPGEMTNRHEGAVGPLSVNGRLIVQGEHTILAYDGYNGQFLWKHENAAALRTGVFQNQNPGNLAASTDRLFHFVKDECLELDAATGKVLATHRLPKKYDDGTREWGYVAFSNGRLIGTATIREEAESRLRRRGRKTTDITDGIFAIDVSTGDHLWSCEGGSITHHTIALSDDGVFFIDSTISSEERERILRDDKTELAALKGEAREIAEDRMKKLDARTAIGLDAATGKQLWSRGVDVTDCSEIGIGGGKLTMMIQDGVLILCGANANGHYWKQFIAGDFKRRRLVAVSAEDGYTLWKKDADYRHRPIIVGERVIAEPWAFDLTSGEQLMKSHPLTGQDVPWSIIRPGHHCGMLTGASHMLLFRSGYTGFYNLENDEGTRHFAGHRLGCWINAIPANGLVMIPEASAGCVCQFSIASTIVLEPRQARRPWTLISATGAQTPVRHMALNLGAPGDRRDDQGTVWLAYPRPNPKKTTSLDLDFDLKPKFKTGGFTSVSAATHPVDGTGTPWLYTSWAGGLSQLTLPLRGAGDSAATYDLKLHFARIHAGTVSFDVEINGTVVLSNLTLSCETDGTPEAQVKLIDGLRVERDLTIRLIPEPDGRAAGQAILNAIEVRQQQTVANAE